MPIMLIILIGMYSVCYNYSATVKIYEIKVTSLNNMVLFMYDVRHHIFYERIFITGVYFIFQESTDKTNTNENTESIEHDEKAAGSTPTKKKSRKFSLTPKKKDKKNRTEKESEDVPTKRALSFDKNIEEEKMYLNENITKEDSELDHLSNKNIPDQDNEDIINKNNVKIIVDHPNLLDEKNGLNHDHLGTNQYGLHQEPNTNDTTLTIRNGNIQTQNLTQPPESYNDIARKLVDDVITDTVQTLNQKIIDEVVFKINQLLLMGIDCKVKPEFISNTGLQKDNVICKTTGTQILEMKRQILSYDTNGIMNFYNDISEEYSYNAMNEKLEMSLTFINKINTIYSKKIEELLLKYDYTLTMQVKRLRMYISIVLSELVVLEITRVENFFLDAMTCKFETMDRMTKPDKEQPKTSQNLNINTNPMMLLNNYFDNINYSLNELHNTMNRKV